jgi:hypothetical protein
MQEAARNLGDNVLPRFAEHLFSDCATRKERRGMRRKVPLEGRTITYGVHPILYRGSDFVRRELMSVLAFEKDGSENATACWETFKTAWRSPYRHLLFDAARRGRKIEPRFKNEAVLLSLQMGKISPDELELQNGNIILMLIQRVKGNVNGLKRRLTRRGYNALQMFEAELGAFRADYARDAAWYGEVEQTYRRWRDSANTTLGSRDRWRAITFVNYARVLHEQGKYLEAARNWKIARERYVVAEPMLDDERAIILDSIDKALAACTDCVAPEAHPEYRVSLTRPR